MSEFYSYEGLRDGGTFKVDATTKSTIASDPKQIIGKVVTVTGDKQAGYGSDGDAPLGFVEMVEKEVGNSDDFVISVVWHQVREDIPCDTSDTAGKWATCDGNGGVKAVAEEGTTNARILAVDKTDSDKAIVKID